MAQPNFGGERDPTQQTRFRTWTDITGQYATEAEFVEFKDGKVRLKKKDGSVVSVPIEKLSQADRELVSRNAVDDHTDDLGSGDDPKSARDKPDDPPKKPDDPPKKPDDPPKDPGDLPEKPDDRPKPTAPQGDTEEAKIFIIVNGQKFPRPGLETFFAQSGVGKDPQCTCNPVAGVFCSCNKVCTCVPVCGCAGHQTPRCACVGHRSCGCDSHRSSGGGRVVGCRCAPVH